MSKFQKTFWLIIIAGLFLSNIGCSYRSNDLDADTNWQDDVVMAKDCGMDGLRCCVDKDPSCFYGMQCCVDPNNPQINMCADNCDCGKEDTFCCADNTCNDGLVCANGRCHPCGSNGDYCCNGDTCNNDLQCYKNTCVQCGLVSNPCCDNAPFCANEDAKDKTRDECLNNICQLCGANSAPACQNEPECLPGHLLNNNHCLPCGQANQPCCQDLANNSNFCVIDGLSCHLGFCSSVK